MTKKANPRLIGVFIIAAIFVFIGTFLLINRDRFFTKTSKSVLYFSGSIKGLNVGSQVVFNGVPVGRVIGITLTADARTMNIEIPVYVESHEKSFLIINSDGTADDVGDKDYFQILIDRGLRARLVPQSILTGQMMIELGFFPNTPIILKNRQTKITEIPTLPSISDELSRTLQTLPLEETFENLNKTLIDIQGLMATLDNDIPVITKNLRTMSSALAATAEKAKDSLGSFAPDSRMMGDVNKMTRDFSAAAQSLRNWADYLERHPEALLKGKGGY